MKEVNASEAATLAATQSLTVIDCYAPWCGPCKVLTPRLEALSADPEFSGVNFVALNVDENSNFAVKHGIKSIPTLLFYKSGEVLHTSSGVPNERVLRSKISEYK